MSAATSQPCIPCPVHPWCIVEGPHEEHTSTGRSVSTVRGREVRVWLVAEADGSPCLHVELAYSPDVPGIDVVDLEPAEAGELAAVLRALVASARS